MNDERLDELLAAARRTRREPPEPPIEAMWAAIDGELSNTPARWQIIRRNTPWGTMGLAAAAALLVGVGIGRWSAVPAERPLAVAAAPVTKLDAPPLTDVRQPLQRATSHYLGETQALLHELQNNPAGAYASQASTLLLTTRLLLDSPAATDTRLHDLLEDLELILAQIATLRTQDTGARHRADVRMIRTALTERDVVPRLRTAAVTLATSND